MQRYSEKPSESQQRQPISDAATVILPMSFADAVKGVPKGVKSPSE